MGNEAVKDELISTTHYTSKKKNLLKALVVLALLMIVIAGLLIIWNKNTHRVASNATCLAGKGRPIIDKAAKYMDGKHQPTLKGYIDELSQFKNYQHDPNCLYPFVVYYFYQNDSKNADLYYGRFKTAIITQFKLVNQDEPVRTDLLSNDVQFLHQQYIQEQQDVYGAPLL